ncbi:MAG: GTPase Era [Chromatiales bacterium]|jgi:GTP-binding protein Era|nr:GTPase Era [Chromatiales bacterium]MDX9767547.1 GTPase Era [Ectothiorhodospiraceae bacterium]
MNEADSSAMPPAEVSRCGQVAIVGRPNVGKSTLLNHLVGMKLAATTRRPHTTRNRILGVVTEGSDQLIFIDTPGIDFSARQLLARTMTRTALATVQDIDVVLLLVEAGQWQDGDARILERLKTLQCPLVLAINKVDRLKDRTALLPYIDQVKDLHPFAAVVPISGLKGDNLDALKQVLMQALPEGEHQFDDEQITDRSERFFVTEIVREKLMDQLGDEVPYAASVQVDEFQDVNGRAEIVATIWVERESQKAIVVGKQGRRIKAIGMAARQDIERLLERRVDLRLWVRHKENWQDTIASIAAMGVDVE